MSAFQDERGTIADLFGGEPVVVTLITNEEGAVRGNHVHHETEQWTLVTRGALLYSDGVKRRIGPGEMHYSPAGKPHAWRALEYTECYVFTKGPRAHDFESDTFRLKEPLLG